MTTRAVVFGGGGQFGIGWEIGLAVGLAEAGVDLSRAGLFIGTSAGASAATLINAGLTPAELLERQVNADLREKEIPAPRTLAQMLEDTTPLRARAKSPLEARQLEGRYAVETPTVPEEARLAVINERLKVNKLQDWPTANIGIVVVDTESGERVVFTRESGVNLAKAIAASSALMGIWPAITIGNRQYIDGGAFSFENADLAAGYDRVLVVQAIPSLYQETNLAWQMEQLEKAGSSVRVIAPSEAVLAGLKEMGGNALDSSVREVSARLGREQGLEEAAKLIEFWD